MTCPDCCKGQEAVIGVELGHAYLAERLTMARESRIKAAEPDRAITIAATAWSAPGMRQLEPGQFLPVEQGCSLRMETDVKFEATSLIKIRIRLFKKIDRSCWAQIEKSYRNILEPERLASVRGRLAVID